MCRPFVPKPLKIEDLDGRERSIHERACVLASYYEKRQWHTAHLPPLPHRPPRFPVVDELPIGPFTAQEVRTDKKYLKKQKTPGTDDIPNEVLLILLNFEITFFIIVEMLSKRWVDAVLRAE